MKSLVKRTSSKEKIVAALAKAGSEGLHHSEIAKICGMTEKAVSVWTAASGRDFGVVSVKKGSGRYMLVAPVKPTPKPVAVATPTPISTQATLAELEKRVEVLKSQQPPVKPARKQRSTKIFQSLEEIRDVAQELYTHWLAKPVDPISVDMVMAAQRAVLPEHRVRKVGSFAQMTAVKKALTKMILDQVEKPALEVEKVEIPSEEARPLNEYSFPQVCGRYHEMKAEMAIKREKRADDIAAGQELVLESQLRIERLLNPVHAGEQPVLHMEGTEAKERICVFGLLKQQEMAVRSETANMKKVVLTKMEPTPVHARLELPSSANWVIVNRKMISHPQVESLQKQAKTTGATLILVNGPGRVFPAIRLINKGRKTTDHFEALNR